MRDKVGRERDRRGQESTRVSKRQWDKDREREKKITRQGLFQMASPEYQTQSAVSNLMEEASFHKSRNLQCFQDPLWVFRQDSPEFLVKSLRAQFMLSIQGNVSSKQDIVFHIKEANPISEHKCYYSQLQRKMAFTFSFSIGREGGGSPFSGARRGLKMKFPLLKEIHFSLPTPAGESTNFLHSTDCCFDGSVYCMRMLLFNICLGEESKLISVCEKLADSISDCDFPSKW